MSLPILGEDVEKAYNKVRGYAENKLDSPKSVNIYLSDDGDVHVVASHNKVEETPHKEFDSYSKWKSHIIEWKRSDPVIRYREVVSRSRDTIKKELLED